MSAKLKCLSTLAILAEKRQEAETARQLTAKYDPRNSPTKTLFIQVHQKPKKVKGQSFDCPATCARPTAMLRPPILTQNSSFVEGLEENIREQVDHFGEIPSALTEPALYDEAGGVHFQNADEVFLTEYAERVDEQKSLISQWHYIFECAFGAMVGNFKAYEPALREMKYAMDKGLNDQRTRLESLEASFRNSGLSTLDLQRKNEEQIFEREDLINLLEDQIEVVEGHIEKQSAVLEIMSKITQNLEQELGDEHEAKEDSELQNAFMVELINQERAKQGMGPMPNTKRQRLAVIAEEPEDSEIPLLQPVTRDDPIILRKALQVATFDLNEMQKQLTDLEEKHKDEVPRREFLDLVERNKTLLQETDDFKTKREETNINLEDMKKQVQKYTEERDELKKKVDEMRVNLTPRPSWEKVGEYFDGGTTEWEEVRQGKSSKETAKVMVQELQKQMEPQEPKFLDGLGTDSAVPKCLRFEGKIRDLRTKRREAEFIVNDLWKERREFLQKLVEPEEAVSEARTSLKDNNFNLDLEETEQEATMMTFPNFVGYYFDSKFPTSEDFKIEWVYNVLEACKRLKLSRKLPQFALMLFGRLEERVYFTFRNDFFRLRTLLRQVSSSRSPPECKLLDFKQLLKSAYSSKPQEALDKLVRIASKQCQAHTDWMPLKFEYLFVETDEGLEGRFFEEMYDQFEAERSAFLETVLNKLASMVGITYNVMFTESDAAGEKTVTMVQLYEAIKSVDANIGEEDIAAALAWVFFQVTILPPVQSLAASVVMFLESGAQGELVATTLKDKLLSDIKAAFPAEDIASKFGDEPTVLKFRTLVRRLKGAALLSSTQLSASSFDMSGFGDGTGGEFLGEGNDNQNTEQNLEDINLYPEFTEDEEEGEEEENK